MMQKWRYLKRTECKTLSKLFLNCNLQLKNILYDVSGGGGVTRKNSQSRNRKGMKLSCQHKHKIVSSSTVLDVFKWVIVDSKVYHIFICIWRLTPLEIFTNFHMVYIALLRKHRNWCPLPCFAWKTAIILKTVVFVTATFFLRFRKSLPKLNEP